MRILLVNKHYFLGSGTESYLFNLQKLLISRGHQVEIFSMKHPQNEPASYEHLFPNQVDYRRLSPFGRINAAFRVIYYPQAARLISKILDDFSPDIAHILNIYHQISPSILKPIVERKIPIVHTLNDYKLICPNYLLFTEGTHCTRCQNGKYFQAYKHRCLHGSRSWSLVAALEMKIHKALKLYEKNVSKFVAPSIYLKSTVENFGVSPDQIVHIPNFLTPSDFHPSTDEGRFVAYIGRLSAEKGLRTLLRAMVQLQDINLNIVGDGPMRLILEKDKENLSVKNVVFSGYLSGKELARAFNRARFTVLPSEWPEVLPTAILESFASRKPVVASRIGGIPEMISHEHDGLLFEPGSEDQLARSLQDLWRDPGRTSEMGESGRKKVINNYNPEIHYDKILSLYRSLS